MNEKTSKAALSEDIRWMLECAEINAEYGYGIRTLEQTNSTAIDLIGEFGERGLLLVRACAKIGWWVCAEGWSYSTEDEARTVLQTL